MYIIQQDTNNIRLNNMFYSNYIRINTGPGRGQVWRITGGHEINDASGCFIAGKKKNIQLIG